MTQAHARSGATDTPFALDAPRRDRLVITVDELIVRAPVREIFTVAAAVEEWPATWRTIVMCAFSNGDPTGAALWT